MNRFLAVCMALLAASVASAQQVDWLLDPSPFRAELREEGEQIVLENGLLRLRFQRHPFALVGFEQMAADRQLLRAAAPLGEFVLDGEVVRVGGLTGQPNRAFLLPEWLADMRRDPAAIDVEPQLQDHGLLAERLPWRRTRHVGLGADWPPAGRHVRWRFASEPFVVD
ncbi:MAG TPA: hypothetical protein ENI87_08910, partial [bacterium]|nr:hypothetical protein [bacterium]